MSTEVPQKSEKALSREWEAPGSGGPRIKLQSLGHLPLWFGFPHVNYEYCKDILLHVK